MCLGWGARGGGGWRRWVIALFDYSFILIRPTIRPSFPTSNYIRQSNKTNQSNLPIPLQSDHANFFETTIRYLGGLLSSYALVVDEIEIEIERAGVEYGDEHEREHEHEHGYNSERPSLNERLPEELERDPKDQPLHLHLQKRSTQASILLARALSLADRLLPAFYAYSSDLHSSDPSSIPSADDDMGEGVEGVSVDKSGPLAKGDMKGVHLEQDDDGKKKKKGKMGKGRKKMGLPAFGVNTVTCVTHLPFSLYSSFLIPHSFNAHSRQPAASPPPARATATSSSPRSRAARWSSSTSRIC